MLYTRLVIAILPSVTLLVLGIIQVNLVSALAFAMLPSVTLLVLGIIQVNLASALAFRNVGFCPHNSHPSKNQTMHCLLHKSSLVRICNPHLVIFRISNPSSPAFHSTSDGNCSQRKCWRIANPDSISCWIANPTQRRTYPLS